MDEQTLEPCPFCGGNDVKLYSPALSRLVAVHCQDCEIRGETAIDTDVAVSNWNTRAAHSVMAGKVAELEWQTIETAPHAMHVLGARFDEAFGEWIYAVVLSPPSQPLTHWRFLPTPPALAPHPKGME